MATDWESLLWQPLYTVKAKTAYHSGHGMDLSFEEGEIIDVLGIGMDREMEFGVECHQFGACRAKHDKLNKLT